MTDLSERLSNRVQISSDALRSYVDAVERAFEGPHVADARAVILASDACLLLADIGPDFIDLDALAVRIAHLFIGERGASLADLHQQTHDRVAVCADN